MVEIRDQIERRPIGSLIPYARNSRTHSDAQIQQLAASMREWGWTNPVLVDEAGGIIAGHGRVLAAQRLQISEVPVIVASGWTDAQKRAYVIADNKLALNAGWDADVLADELASLRDGGFDLDLVGFDADELDGLLGDDDESDGLTDPDETPEPPAQPVTRTGDVWVMGQHRLRCGDSTSAADMAALMGGGMADVWITDPPYNVAVVGGSRELTPQERKARGNLTIESDSMPAADFRAFLASAFTCARDVMKPGASFYIWHADVEGYNFRGACADVGLQVRQCLIWKKHAMVLGRQDYHWLHEPCLYGWKDGAGHLWASDRKQTTVLEFDRPMRNADHPTMMPVALIEYQLLNNTKGGDVLLDSFGGSGTALIAAEKNGRIARLMEIDPRYCDVIVRRWQDFTGQQAQLESTGQSWSYVATERARA